MKAFLLDTILFRMKRTAEWRRERAATYPRDQRNVRAACRLDELARGDTDDVSPATWVTLAPYAHSKLLPDAISEAARTVEFHNRPDGLDSFLQIVAEKLSATGGAL